MAVTAARNTPIMGAGGLPVLTNYPVAATTTIYEGTLVAINSSGYLVEATTTSTLKVVGMALESVDNSAGSNGDKYCNVQQGVARWVNGASITLSSVGALVYVVDNETVTTSAAGSPPIAGTLYHVDSEGCWVYSGLAAPVDGSALTDFINLLASTSAAEGASLVGIEDSPSLFTGSTVEAALLEVVKKANAANGVPFNFQIALSAIVTATTNIVSWAPPTAGKILRLDACPIVAPTTADKAITFTVKISDQATSATLAVTTTTLAVAGSRVSGNVATTAPYAAGKVISIAPSLVTTFVEGSVLLSIFVQSA